MYIYVSIFLYFLVHFRMAVERDLEKSEYVHLANIVFDESGNFLMYATLLGVKLVNIYTNRCVRIIGKTENLRPLHLALFQVNINMEKSARFVF